MTGSVRMMRALLPAGPDPTRRNRFGGISLVPAAERGHVGYVRAVLAETDVEVDHVNRLGWTALPEAVILGDGGARHEEVVRLLLAAGADPWLADSEGVTAHEHAVRRGFGGLALLLRAAQERSGHDGCGVRGGRRADRAPGSSRTTPSCAPGTAGCCCRSRGSGRPWWTPAAARSRWSR